MRSIICAALLCAAPFAHAVPTAVFQGDNVRVYAYTDPCELPQLAAILSQYGPASYKALVIFGGVEIPACFTIAGDQVLVIDADGDGGAIPLAAFKEAKNV